MQNMVDHNYRVFLFLLDRKPPARRSSEFVLDFVKVITAIVSMAPVIDCKTSPRCDARGNVGRASGGAMGGRLSVKNENTCMSGNPS